MNQVVKAATPEEIARVEAQNKQAEAAQASKPAPPRLVGKEGKERERVIPLEFSVEYDGKVYEELTVRRISGKDFSAMSAFDGSKETTQLAALMTGAPVEVIEALDGDDFVELQEAVQAFLPRKLRQMAEQLSGTGPNTQR
ncbi:phage tail assembly protein [Ensifer sp. MPMI2T]|nr:phage tail assembly protein [Ensifer sp. MPMI2T]